MTTQTETFSSRIWIAIGLLVVCVALAVYYFAGGNSSAAPPNTVHVQGVVTFKGQPLKMGLVVFEPDSTKGGSGSQGYANIVDGKFDTQAKGGKSVSLGASIIRVTGGDGVGIDAFTPFGSMLFEEYSTTTSITEGMPPLSIDVPVSKGFVAPKEN